MCIRDRRNIAPNLLFLHSVTRIFKNREILCLQSSKSATTCRPPHAVWRRDVYKRQALLLSLTALVVSASITYYIADSAVDLIFFGVALYSLLSGLILILSLIHI